MEAQKSRLGRFRRLAHLSAVLERDGAGMADAKSTPAGTVAVPPRSRFPEGSRTLNPPACLAAALSLAAALIHLWVMPEHFLVWWGYGLFFLTTALAQGLYGVLVLRWPRQALALVGILANVAVVTLYVASRTSGVPLGPHAGQVENTGVLDMSATVAELATIVALMALLGETLRRRTLNFLLVLGAAIWALRLAGILS